MTKVITRKKAEELTDAQKFQILQQYSEGVPVTQIALGVSRDLRGVRKFIQATLKGMNAIHETNKLAVGTHSAALTAFQGQTPGKFITKTFLSELDEKAEVYAYYFAQTNDNKFAIVQSGMDCGMARNMRKQTKEYVYRIRGQFLRDIPLVKDIIRAEQAKRVKEYIVEKPQVQMEIVHQIDELKEVVANDPRQRANLLKAIEMLGKTIGAFIDRVETTETDARSGLEILMEKAKKEATGTYEVTDVTQEEEC